VLQEEAGCTVLQPGDSDWIIKSVDV
jgi:hypothetical protein